MAHYLPFRSIQWLTILLVGCAFATLCNAAIVVLPTEVQLDRPESTQQLLVLDQNADDFSRDLTRKATYQFQDPSVATISAEGLIHPLATGTTHLQITIGDQRTQIQIRVGNLQHPEPVSFHNEIIPILTKSGCNSGGCHGKAEGQNGFKLSVFGFDPQSDHDALVRESRGRRVFPGAPERSVLLRKATGVIPHGGGLKIQPTGLAYQRLVRWVAEGAVFDNQPTQIRSLQVRPGQLLLNGETTQQLQVTAIDSLGRERCVTVESEYLSNATEIVQVDKHGLATPSGLPGEAAILVRYLDQVAVCRLTVPQNVVFQRPPEVNFIDRLVWDKLEQLGIQPSPFADDATFLRRAFLDVTGSLPEPNEVQVFLENPHPDKRKLAVTELLNRPAYADYWTMRWSDILRVDRDKMTPQGAIAITRWLRQQFRDNRSYAEMVRSILTAKGHLQEQGPTALFRVLDSAELLSRSISQAFLGVRIECAQCHHHPFEKWGQDDYYAFAGFFTGLKRKSIPGGGQALLVVAGTDFKHPRNGHVLPAKALGSNVADLRGIVDRREFLASWMTDKKNPYFSRVLVNRLWAHYFGRGIVEPIDDLRATNPPVNEPLLDALAQYFVDINYDLKTLTQTLLETNVYRLASKSNSSNVDDLQNFSRARPKALPAEVLLDIICQATGTSEKFEGWPLGYRAVQIWDNQMPSYFFRIFGRPVRASVCECERSNEPSMAQALHLINSPEIGQKLRSPSGRVQQLTSAQTPPDQILEQLFLATLSRLPSAQERSRLLKTFASTDATTAAEDILWVLLNTKEFLYNH